jgi:hypothetical protein
MPKCLSKNEFVKLKESLLSAGYKIDAVKVMDRSFVNLPNYYAYVGIKLRISPRLLARPLPKDKLAKLAEAVFSSGYEIKSLKVIRKLWGFRSIKLLIV